MTLKTNFQIVVRVFIELRNKGASLSARDLDVLENWEKLGIDPNFICKVMYEMYTECEKKDIPFPKSFLKISKKVDTIIAKIKEI